MNPDIKDAIDTATHLVEVIRQYDVPQPARAILTAQVFILVKKLECIALKTPRKEGDS